MTVHPPRLRHLPENKNADLNAEPEPPDRKLREVEQGIRAGKRDTLVGAISDRQSTFGKHPLKGREGNSSLVVSSASTAVQSARRDQ